MCCPLAFVFAVRIDLAVTEGFTRYIHVPRPTGGSAAPCKSAVHACPAYLDGQICATLIGIMIKKDLMVTEGLRPIDPFPYIPIEVEYVKIDLGVIEGLRQLNKPLENSHLKDKIVRIDLAVTEGLRRNEILRNELVDFFVRIDLAVTEGLLSP